MTSNEDSAARAYAERLTQHVKDAGDELRDADQQLRSFVKENPLLALAIAVASGYLIGRALARS